MNTNHTVNYIEMPSRDLVATKAFFHKAFGWVFRDYGPAYTAFEDIGVDGGFYYQEAVMHAQTGSALVILYAHDLLESYHLVVKSGGIITQEIFDFPGGQRFHFIEPSGNEFAVWSE